MDYLLRLRWPDGYRCPRCHHDENWQIGEKKYKCRKCGYQTTVTAGTIFQDSHLPLTIWFRAIWHIISKEAGTDAVELQKFLGLGSYRTAWAMLLKIRKAMVLKSYPKLKGTVAVDEVSLPRSRAGKRIRLYIAVECYLKGKAIVDLGQIRVGLANEKSLSFIQSNVKPGSTIVSTNNYWDGTHVCRLYRHLTMNRQPYPIGDMLPPVYTVISRLLEKNLLCTHQQLCSGDHLDYYLAECCFKYNHRKITSAQAFFDELLCSAVNAQPLPYNEIVGQK